jgi:gas vesicle protein
LQNILNATVKVGKDWKANIAGGITDFKVNADGTSSYKDSKGILQNVKDSKNTQFIQDQLDKQWWLQWELDIINAKQKAETESMIELNDKRKQLEDDFNDTFNQNINSQKKWVKDLFNAWVEWTNRSRISLQQLIADMRTAISLQDSLSAWRWFASWGYTWSGGKYDIAGVVHKWEYVMPQWMVSKYSWLVSQLETARVWGFAEGGYTSTTNKSINIGSVNVRDGFDFESAMSNVKRRL